MTAGGTLAAGALEGRRVRETRHGALLRLDVWEDLVRGLICGVTTAEAGTFGVSDARVGEWHDAYGSLAAGLGFDRVRVPLQVHGTDVVTVGPSGSTGPTVELAGRVDGQVTAERGLLLASTAADCVPVHILDPAGPRLGLVHAGWRGAAGGILERAVAALGALDPDGTGPDGWRLHLGPAICGACYEVDRPVLEAFGLAGERACLDLRGMLTRRALEIGFRPEAVTVSALCTRCGPEPLHSHRGSGAAAGRMAAFLGVRPG